MVIRINNLCVYTIIGTYDWERETPRELRLHIEITPKTDAAAVSDNLTDGVDYSAISEKIVSLGKASRFLLVEKFAAEALKIVLDHPLVRSAKVEVIKPTPIPAVDSVSITVTGEK